MLCDPCVSACALLSFALKAPILGTGLANLKTTILTPCYRNYLCSLLGGFGKSSSPRRNPLCHVALVDEFVVSNTPKSEQVVVFRLDVV